jgi:hypothetical protein
VGLFDNIKDAAKNLIRDFIEPECGEREALNPENRAFVELAEERIKTAPLQWQYDMAPAASVPVGFVLNGAIHRRYTFEQPGGMDLELREFRAVSSVVAGMSFAAICYNELYARDNSAQGESVQGEWQLVLGDPHSFLARQLQDALLEARYRENTSLEQSSMPDFRRESHSE